MLLHLVKHSRPDLSNVTQELSRVMGKATEGHMKELCRVIKYALDTQNIGLKLKPEDNNNNNGNYRHIKMQTLQATKRHVSE